MGPNILMSIPPALLVAQWPKLPQAFRHGLLDVGLRVDRDAIGALARVWGEGNAKAEDVLSERRFRFTEVMSVPAQVIETGLALRSEDEMTGGAEAGRYHLQQLEAYGWRQVRQ